MTTTTIGSKFAIMDIIGAMAVATATIDCHHLVQRASVAIFTDDADMRAGKRKARL